MNTFGKYNVVHLAFVRCSIPHLSTNTLDRFGFGVTTMKRKVNHIATLFSIKHFTSLSYLTDTVCPSIKYKEIPFSQLFPYVYCVFMTRDLICIESNDKKFALV